MDFIPSNPTAKHRSVVWLRGETHEMISENECSGRPVYKVDLFPIYFDGDDKNIAVRKLNELLAELKQRCDSNR